MQDKLLEIKYTSMSLFGNTAYKIFKTIFDFNKRTTITNEHNYVSSVLLLLFKVIEFNNTVL